MGCDRSTSWATRMNIPAYKKILGSRGVRSIAQKATALKVLAEVQALTTEFAAASATTASRLDSVNTQVEQTNASLDSMLQTADELNGRFQRVSTASATTLTAAGEMESLSNGG